MEQRLISLEERFLFLEQHLVELDGVVRSIGDDLASMRREVHQNSAQAEHRHQQMLERLESEGEPDGSSR